MTEVINFKNFEIWHVLGGTGLWYYSVFDKSEDRAFKGRFYCSYEALISKLELSAVEDYQVKLI